jgi:hypothetical protein
MSTLGIADDLAPIDRDLLDTASKATFARLIHGNVIRREDVDAGTGRTLGRLGNLGVLANADRPPGVKFDPPILHDDVAYSLLLDREVVA